MKMTFEELFALTVMCKFVDAQFCFGGKDELYDILLNDMNMSEEDADKVIDNIKKMIKEVSNGTNDG